MKCIYICIEISTIIGQPKCMCDTLCQNQLINISSKGCFAVIILLSHKQVAQRTTQQDLCLTLRFLAEYKTHICNTCLICPFEWRGANLVWDGAEERDVSSSGGCDERWMWKWKCAYVPLLSIWRGGKSWLLTEWQFKKNPVLLSQPALKILLIILQPLSVLIAPTPLPNHIYFFGVSNDNLDGAEARQSRRHVFRGMEKRRSVPYMRELDSAPCLSDYIPSWKCVMGTVLVFIYLMAFL